MTLLELFEHHEGHTVSKFTHYMPIYEQYLERFRDTKVNLLELGIGEGGSLELWREYLGDKARIFGADRYGVSSPPEYYSRLDNEFTETHYFEQENPESIKKLIAYLPKMNIIIDDCGHYPPYQRHTFEIMFPYLADNGLYFCEDIQHSFVKIKGFGWKHQDSFVEYCKSLIDAQNATFSDQEKEIPTPDFSRQIKGIYFHLNMIVIEKWSGNIYGGPAQYGKLRINR